jgi:uncharacterized protein YutE (UPF0331/DUF86 family)
MKKIDDVLINKITSIRKCVARAREDYAFDEKNFATNFTQQDSAILNVNRACEQSIDLANHIVKLYKLGVPNEALDSFNILAKSKIIDEDLAQKMGKMIGFRNISIHEYEKLNIDIVIEVITKKIDDLLLFTDVILEQQKKLNS